MSWPATQTLWIVVPAGCVAALAYAAWRPWWAWRIRKLPGPKRRPLLGNLPDIIASGSSTLWREQMARRYGTVYKMWHGLIPMVVVTDVDLARKVLTSCTSRPNLKYLSCLTGELYYLATNGLLSLSPDVHGQKFRSLRKAFELAVLTPAALAAHAPTLAECASRLVTHLSRYAASGEPVDVTGPLSDMTMDAIGFAAFGLDLNCLGAASAKTGSSPTSAGQENQWMYAPPGSPEFSQGLVQACRTQFRYLDITQSSRWKLLCIFMPGLYNVTRRVANLFPDRLLKLEVQNRQNVAEALRVLIAKWNQQKAATASTNGSAPLPAISDRGFMAKVLEAAQTEEGIGELDVVAQTVMMVLAGYETTASTLAATLHLLALNPKAQVRLQAELDDVLKGTLATSEDLERLPYLCGVLDEALRLYPAGDAVTVRLLTPRDKDLDLGDGRVIPGGAFVWADVHAIHRDPAVWPRATEFLPERFIQPGNEALAPSNPHASMPFGLGARKCVGFKYALLEGRLALARLLQAYTFTPAPSCPAPKWKSGIVYTPDHVWLTVSAR